MMSTLSKRADSDAAAALAADSRADESLWRGEAGPPIQIGFESTAERRQVLDWLGAGLRPHSKGCLPFEYPLVFDQDECSHHLTLWREGVPAAFCTLWEAPFRIRSHRLRTGMISFVYTDPKQRGHGYATQLVRAAARHAADLELGVVLLWSDLERLYSPLGFTRAGRESMLVLGADTLDRALGQVLDPAFGSETAPPPPAQGLLVETAKPDDWLEIERIRNRRTSQLDLAPGEITRSQSIPRMSVRVARSEAGVMAFAIRGRGDDFEEVIHEWGGDPRGVLLCCQALLETTEPWGQLLLLCPPTREDATWALRRAGARQIGQPLCWMRVGSAAALARDLQSGLPESVELEISESIDRTASEAERSFHVRTQHASAQFSHTELLEFVFGTAPGTPRMLEPTDVTRLLGPANGAALPLPFFVWGLESI